jgi:sulfide:quinone oxidoreductase
LALPKAAVFAEAQGKVVAAQIAALATGGATRQEFDGKGFCFVEFGGHAAMGGEASFFEVPNPQVVTRTPDGDQYEEKHRWASEFLKRYF